ncbi:exported hypothetical protein [uncultured delta proteobacterium]|uniref:BON domain-containing protein n=1 Tax=uncultured delta proteobacterium TaxID=34034 RepID=A0A212IZB4_9DELT|nr:exported hypothetical protein [uncultured delta proteobacterium]
MIRKTVYGLAPVFFFLLFTASSPAYAADGAGALSTPVSVEDLNPILSKSVKYELSRVDGLNTPDIRVASNEGTVTLMGRVGSNELRAEAERIARDVPGVRRVINNLWVHDSLRDTALPFGG